MSHLKDFGAEDSVDNSQLPHCTLHFALKSFESEVKPCQLDDVFHQHFIMLIYYRKTQHKWFVYCLFKKLIEPILQMCTYLYTIHNLTKII